MLKLLKFPSGFVFVRENVKSDAPKEWVTRFKGVLDKHSDRIIYFSLNANTNTVRARGNSTDKPVGILKAYLDAGVEMHVFKDMVTTASCLSPPAFGIDAILCRDPEIVVVIFVKEMLLAGMCFCIVIFYLSLY